MERGRLQNGCLIENRANPFSVQRNADLVTAQQERPSRRRRLLKPFVLSKAAKAMDRAGQKRGGDKRRDARALRPFVPRIGRIRYGDC